MDPGRILGFAAAGCVWAMGMVLEWSGRRHAPDTAVNPAAIVAALAWEDAPAQPPSDVEEQPRAA